MIKVLDRLSELVFPVATLEKTPDIKDDGSYIYYNGQALLKQGNLLDTFNINIPFLPTTYHYLYNPETLLAAPSILKSKLIIDSKLNTYLPIKKIKLVYKTSTFMERHKNYIKVSDCWYFIPEVSEKFDKYPLICKVEGATFLVGWESERVKSYEAFI